MSLQTISNATQATVNKPNVSEFTNYREYLAAFYNYKRELTKKDLRPYSYQHFSAAANIKSPNYLKLVIEGKRNLSEKMVLSFAKALGLNKNQTEEFLALVNYTQAKQPLERNRCLKVLSDLRVNKKIKDGSINQENMERLPSWVTWALIALTDQQDASFEVEDLRNILKGRANKDEIKRCLDKLIDSGELTRNEETGKIEKGRHNLKDAEKIPAEAIKKLQAELIYLGLEALYNDDQSDREFGTLTMTLTEEEFKKLRFELRHFRKKIFKDALLNRESAPGDRVFQLNLQLFALTEPTKN